MPSELKESEATLSGILPSTRFFEVDSAIVGARFGVWVTTPALYDREPDATYPAIYAPDGNMMVGQIAAAMPLLRYDPINPIQPFVQVSVGFVGEDATRALAVRARDLLPPGEPLLPGTEEAMPGTVAMGLLDQTGADLYLHNLRHPAADRFLAFLTEELHPLIAAHYRVDRDEAGLWGYSYGGLFATYAALQRTALFRRIGAGSPGILPGVSTIFADYRRELAGLFDHGGRMLHMTVCGPELTVASYYQPIVAAGTAEFIALAGQSPLQGLRFSSHIVPHESHATGGAPSWFSFLRACYGVSS